MLALIIPIVAVAVAGATSDIELNQEDPPVLFDDRTLMGVVMDDDGEVSNTGPVTQQPSAMTGFSGFLDVLDGLDVSEPTMTVETPKKSLYKNSDNALIKKTNLMQKCGHLTKVDGKLHSTFDVSKTCMFWVEGVISSGVAACGLIGNLISIWILSVPQMRSTAFNRLLLALAIIDCMFIVPGIIIYTAKVFGWKADWYNRLFPFVFYPLAEIALCSSIYMTVAIAVERYIGLCRPLQRLSGRPCSAKAYILPVLAIAIALNIPKFLEAETIWRTDPRTNITRSSIGVTELRLHPDYITYYWVWTRLFATGIIPLVILAMLNSKIYFSIRKSKHRLRSLAIRSALPMAILGTSPAVAAAAAAASPSASRSLSPPPNNSTNIKASY